MRRTFKTQGIMYPTEKDKFVSSKPVTELIKILDEYVFLVIDYIKENSARTKLLILPGLPPPASPVSTVDIPL